jgi:hypothetical protein
MRPDFVQGMYESAFYSEELFSIISVPLDADEEMQLGYVTVAKRELGELGRIYIDEIKKYDPALKE